jgi:hypothetical protein
MRRHVLAAAVLAARLAPPLAATPPSLDVRGLAFTPVSPCRVLDTRALSGSQGAGDGPLTAGQPYAFDVSAGEAADCLVPDTARAALLNFVAASATGNGNLRIWAWDDQNAAQPTTSTLNYTSGFNSANGVTSMLCNPSTASDGDCSRDLYAQLNGGSAHLVVDVLGYYSAPGSGPLWGEGRPGAARLAGFLGYCSGPGNVVFGLSRASATWNEAASACPAGTWVCTAAQRGTSVCDVFRPDTTCDGNNCDGDCLDSAHDNHVGWLADLDSDLTSVGSQGLATGENGFAGSAAVCARIPVWCCSLEP